MENTISLDSVTPKSRGRHVSAATNVLPRSEPHQQESTPAASQRVATASQLQRQWSWKMDANLRFCEPDDTSYTTERASQWFIGKTRTDVMLDSYGVNRISEITSTTFDRNAFEHHLETLARHEPFNNFIYQRKQNGRWRWRSVSGVPLFDPSEPGRFVGYHGIAADITHLRKHLDRNGLLSRVLENSEQGLAVISETNHLIHCNQAFRDLLGMSMARSTCGASLEQMLLDFNQSYDSLLEQKLGMNWIDKSLELLNEPCSKGEWTLPNDRWLDIKSKRSDDGTLIMSVTDVSELKNSELALEAERNLLRSVINTIPDSIFARDKNLRYLAINNATAELLGVDDTESCLGKVTVDKSLPACQIEALQTEELEIMATGESVSKKLTVENKKFPGKQRTLFLNKVPLKDPNGEIIGLVGYSRDQTDILNLTDQLAYQAEHDALTGLINRRGFDQRVEHAISQYRTSKTPSVVCFADLDQFKIVNDTVGHKAGDELLKQITQLISRRIRRDDVFARLGGDEFGMIFRNCRASEILDRIATIIKDIASYRFKWEDKLFEIGASIGIVELGDDSETVESICSRADVACYTAKDLGRSRFHVFSNEDQESTERQNQLEKAADIRTALDENRFELHMQPIARTGNLPPSIHHYEVLVRMIDTDGSIVSPGIFIPAAERFKLMGAVDRWVINQAMANYNTVFQGKANTIMTINLSGNSLTDPELVGYVKACIKKYQINPQHLCFEITETAFISQLSIAQEFISELGKLGCEFALDDFGSGLSSFAYLKNFNINYLKIDGGFVRNMVEDSTDRAMVKAIHTVGNEMGIATIAEFVESEQHIELLEEIGVDYVQGYAIGKPLPMLDGPID